MEHVLKEAGGLEAHALSACVGAGNKEDVLLRGKGYRKRDYCLFLPPKGPLQKGMAGLPQPQGAVFAHNGHSGNIGQRHAGLSHNEVQLSYKLGSGNELRHKRPQEFGKFIQYLGNFPGFGKMEF